MSGDDLICSLLKWYSNGSPVIVGHGEYKYKEYNSVKNGGEEESIFEYLVVLFVFLFDELLFVIWDFFEVKFHGFVGYLNDLYIYSSDCVVLIF